MTHVLRNVYSPMRVLSDRHGNGKYVFRNCLRKLSIAFMMGLVSTTV